MWPSKKIKSPVVFETELKGFRVLLRAPRIEDQAEWLGLRKKNRLFLMKYEPKWGRDALTEEFFKRRLERLRKDWEDDRNYSFLMFKRDTPPEGAREDHSGNTLIGGININNVCRGAAQYGTLGYWIDEGHQKHGYMRAGLRMIIHFAYEELKLHRLHAATLPDNERSQNLLMKMGFEKEGRARKYIEINGIWEDHILFGLVLEDYMKQVEEE